MVTKRKLIQEKEISVKEKINAVLKAQDKKALP